MSTMRTLIRCLEEAAPAPGSKEWLSGVKKWWNQWVKDAGKVSKIRDPKDRKSVLAWFADGEKRIAILKDALVRALGLADLITLKDLAKKSVGSIENLGMGGPGLKLPAKVAGRSLAHNPQMKVLPYLEAALGRLRARVDAEKTWFQVDYPRTPEDQRMQAMHGGASSAQYGRGRDLNAWQAGVEALGTEVDEIDREVQAAFRAFAQIAPKTFVDMERTMEKSVPLEYSLGAMKVLTVPGSSVDLRAQARAPEGEGDDQQVNVRMSRVVLDGLKAAQRALKQSGFGGLWYGKVYVAPAAHGEEYTKAKSGVKFRSGGHYHSMGDAVMINIKAGWDKQVLAEVIVHELGHRYWFKNMKAGARARFSAWFDPRSKADQEREGAKAGYVPAPTSYGAESVVEEFAEVFAMYVLGRYRGSSLTGPQKARFEALALGRAARSESLSAILCRLEETFEAEVFE